MMTTTMAEKTTIEFRVRMTATPLLWGVAVIVVLGEVDVGETVHPDLGHLDHGDPAVTSASRRGPGRRTRL
jgi:hypothetical protein